MSEPFLGEIRLISFGFPPKGWAFCVGQLLPINQNQALFSILGTTYGGDGRTTFALPDLRDRTAINFGQGPGLSNYVLGQNGGQPAVTLTIPEMPAHTHQAQGNNSPGAASVVNGNWAASTANAYSTVPANAVMDPSAVGLEGNSQPHQNMPPYLAVNYVIALVGIFPSRN